VAAVPVAGGGSEGQVDVTELWVVAHHRPDVGVAGIAPGVVLPGLVSILAGLRNGVENPELLTGPHVEAAHVAGWHLFVVLEVVHRTAHYDDVSADDGRGRDGDMFPNHRLPHAEGEVYAATLPESRDRLTGLGIQSAEVGVVRADDDATVFAARPVGHASMHKAIGLRIVHPECLAGGRVDGCDLVKTRDRVEHATHHEGRGLVRAGAEFRAGLHQGVVWGVPLPHDPQVLHVLGVDLGKGRVARAGVVAAVNGPFAVLRAVLGLLGGGLRECNSKGHEQCDEFGFQPLSTGD
jgi:hypothetical protein